MTPSSWTFDFHAARDAAEVAEQRVARPEFDDLVAVAELARAAKAHGEAEAFQAVVDVRS